MASSETLSLFSLNTHGPLWTSRWQSTMTFRWARFRNVQIMEAKGTSMMGLGKFPMSRDSSDSLTLDNSAVPCVE